MSVLLVGLQRLSFELSRRPVLRGEFWVLHAEEGGMQVGSWGRSRDLAWLQPWAQGEEGS